MWTEARHIQVKTERQATELMQRWQRGADFGEIARGHSECPTAAQDGYLGLFGPGHMPAELDQVFQNGEPGCVYGPIQSKHGYHLVELIARRNG